MRALVQRVVRASVSVGGEVVGEVGRGACVLVGVGRGDGVDTAERLAAKVWHLRIHGPSLDRPLAEGGGAALVVSQFTLYADTTRGRRPSWSAAAPPGQAGPLVEAFCEAMERLGADVSRGRFGAHMQLELVNDGPVSLLLEA